MELENGGYSLLIPIFQYMANKVIIFSHALPSVLRTAALPILVVFAVSCSRLGPMPSDGASGTSTVASTPNLHFFFDRTESMRGFLIKGNDSDYVKSMRALWEAGAAMPSQQMRIFDYGDAYTREYKASAFQKVIDDVRKESFYGLKGSLPRSDSNCDWVKNNNERPFSSVADYIKDLDAENTQASNAYIIVTDLYDPGTPNPFVRFFSDTFSREKSGAIFAIKSSFSGTIESISSTGNKEQNIKVKDGMSTFFVCVIGDSALVAEYSAALAKDLAANKITFNNAVFMVKQGENIKTVIAKPRPANKREFSDSKNAFVSMNIDKENLNARAPSYRILKFDSSRWSAGLPLSNINFDNFAYNSNLRIQFSDGNKKKTKGDSAGWQSLDAANFSAKTRKGSKVPLYFAVDTKNKPLSAGYYKIDYGIVPEAKTAPRWVTQLNAPDIQTLEASAQESGTSVKVLQLANVYEKIAAAYNKVNSKNIYAGTLYLVKR